MGLAGGLARGSARAAGGAGLAGAVLGAGLALVASAGLARVLPEPAARPGRSGPGRTDAGPRRHLGGRRAGGRGGVRARDRGRAVVNRRAAVGGLIGALLAAFFFEATAAMAFPKAATTRPLANPRVSADGQDDGLAALGGRRCLPARRLDVVDVIAAGACTAGARGDSARRADGPGPEQGRTRLGGPRQRERGARGGRATTRFVVNSVGPRGRGPAKARSNGSILVGADHLAAVAGAEAPPDGPGDRVLDEPDAAVGHGGVHSARVGTGGAGCSRRWASRPCGFPVSYMQPPNVSLGVWMVLNSDMPIIPGAHRQPG